MLELIDALIVKSVSWIPFGVQVYELIKAFFIWFYDTLGWIGIIALLAILVFVFRHKIKKYHDAFICDYVYDMMFSFADEWFAIGIPFEIGDFIGGLLIYRSQRKYLGPGWALIPFFEAWLPENALELIPGVGTVAGNAVGYFLNFFPICRYMNQGLNIFGLQLIPGLSKFDPALSQAKYVKAFFMKAPWYGVNLEQFKEFEANELEKDIKTELDKKDYYKVWNITKEPIKLMVPALAEGMIRTLSADGEYGSEQLEKAKSQVADDLWHIIKHDGYNDDAFRKIAEVVDKAREMLGLEEEKPKEEETIRNLLKKDEMMEEAFRDD